jgi:hypothetical protein
VFPHVHQTNPADFHGHAAPVTDRTTVFDGPNVFSVARGLAYQTTLVRLDFRARAKRSLSSEGIIAGS